MPESGAIARVETAQTEDGKLTQFPSDHPLVRALERQKLELLELRPTAKSGAEALAKLAAIEEAQKTEAQKAAEKAAEMERRATDAELKALRYEVGVDKQVPSNLLRYLAGATKEELEANAAQLITDFGADTATSGGQARRPQEALRAGASAAAMTTDPNQVINDRIRQAAGRRS